MQLGSTVATSSLNDALEKRLGIEEAQKWMAEQGSAYRELMTYYTCALMEVETKFKVLNEEFNIDGDTNPVESIKTRVKSPESLVEKVLRKGLPLTVESIENGIFDVAGIRVICSFQSDIYRLADALLSQDDVELVERKDYIANPKVNGYRSLHLIVATPIYLYNQKKVMKVEVQLRTLAMNVWASLEHKIFYKKEGELLTNSIRAELLGCADLCAEVDSRMESIRLKTE